MKVLTLSTLGYPDRDEGMPQYSFFWIMDVLNMCPFRWILSWPAFSREAWPCPRLSTVSARNHELAVMLTFLTGPR